MEWCHDYYCWEERTGERVPNAKGLKSQEHSCGEREHPQFSDHKLINQRRKWARDRIFIPTCTLGPHGDFFLNNPNPILSSTSDPTAVGSHLSFLPPMTAADHGDNSFAVGSGTAITS
ncbi:hypothetical protein CRG98_040182 [Punica granatum]|uniref:Uncharacterized protein n=1 Tax=Punica granatum TaxID=22663 RepID=A0A2I0I5Z4_PUNGR|nr:hypothetical protein CRG98_040182 [Punica granatum]